MVLPRCAASFYLPVQPNAANGQRGRRNWIQMHGMAAGFRLLDILSGARSPNTAAPYYYLFLSFLHVAAAAAQHKLRFSTA